MFDFSYANILHSNLINFIIMILLFIRIFCFLNVPKMLENSANEVKKDIEKSDIKKEKSKNELEYAEKKYKDSDKEIENIINDASKISDGFMEKAQNDANSLINGIKEDYEKIYKREIGKMKKGITLDIYKKSLQKTETKLKEAFKDEKIQEKYINESIEKLEGIDL